MDECTNEKQTSAGNSPTGIVSTSREILQENPEANNGMEKNCLQSTIYDK